MQKYAALLALASAGVANAASLSDIKHVVMLMMENRSFQHYFGTMSGVRGFADPNVLISDDGVPIWYQNVTTLTDEADWLLPYWLNYVSGEEAYNKSQCLCAGDNNWIPTQQIMQSGFKDWATIDTPQAWGYFKRQDIPYHYALAEAYTVSDHYHAAISTNTDSNRWFWQSGTINVPGSGLPLDAGGVVLDDDQTNGCAGTYLDCLPLKWKAYAQVLDEAGIDWRSYQNSYDWATNSGLFYFEAFQNSSTDSSLYQRGLVFDGNNSITTFQERALNGTLPEVSWVFPPGALQEHSPNAPNDGAYFINEIVGSVINGAAYKDTLVLLNYDEGGGWGDAVMPIVPPYGTVGEWFQDPYDEVGYTFSGPGIRIPLIMISPFTRGGQVFTERGDHSSILLFLEAWLEARGYKTTQNEYLTAWRRESQSNLLNAFDFENPDYSIPDLPTPKTPIKNDEGEIIGMYAGFCDLVWTGTCGGSEYINGIPYGNQTLEDSLYYEDGYKLARGYMTEGHYLVFESNGYALTNAATSGNGKKATEVTATKATSDHSSIEQRWVLHDLTVGGTVFQISSAVNGDYIASGIGLSSSDTTAQPYQITYLGNSEYSIQEQNGKYLNINNGGNVELSDKATSYTIYSVTYHS